MTLSTELTQLDSNHRPMNSMRSGRAESLGHIRFQSERNRRAGQIPEDVVQLPSLRMGSQMLNENFKVL